MYLIVFRDGKAHQVPKIPDFVRKEIDGEYIKVFTMRDGKFLEMDKNNILTAVESDGAV